MAICSHLIPSLIDVLHRCTQSEKIFRSTASLRQPPPLNQTIPSRAADFAGHFFFMCIIQAHTHTRFPSLILQIIFLPLWTWLRKMVDNNDQKVFWLVRPPVFLCLAATQYFPYTDRNSCHLSCINLSAKRVFLSFLLFLYVDDKKGSNLLSMRKWNQRKPFTRSHYSINLVAYR